MHDAKKDTHPFESLAVHPASVWCQRCSFFRNADLRTVNPAVQLSIGCTEHLDHRFLVSCCGRLRYLELRSRQNELDHVLAGAFSGVAEASIAARLAEHTRSP